MQVYLQSIRYALLNWAGTNGQREGMEIETKLLQRCLEFMDGCGKKTMYKMRWENANTNIFLPIAHSEQVATLGNFRGYEVTTLDEHWALHTRKS